MSLTPQRQRRRRGKREVRVKKCINVRRVYISGDSYPGFLLRSSSPPPLPNSASLSPSPPSLIWIPFLGSVMGLLVWLMHCDLLQLTVYIFMCKIKKKRGGGVSLPFLKKDCKSRMRLKQGHREKGWFHCFYIYLYLNNNTE